MTFDEPPVYWHVRRKFGFLWWVETLAVDSRTKIVVWKIVKRKGHYFPACFVNGLDWFAQKETEFITESDCRAWIEAEVRQTHERADRTRK